MKKSSGSKKINTVIKYTLLLLFTASIFQTSTYAQERKLIYDVMRNGNIIGKIDIVELTKDQKKFLSLTSDVKTRFIFPFTIQTAETAAYEDGVMIYSSFYEKQTGSGKANKTTIASGKCYRQCLDDSANLNFMWKNSSNK